MRWIRPITIILLIVTAAAFFGLKGYDRMYADHDAPVITAASDSIRVKVKSGEKTLLKGLTATDEQDGDLTSQIVVESIGPMLSDGSRTVNYVVCDSSNNAGYYSRTLKYKNYRSPRFYLTEPLRFPAEEAFDLSDYLTARDVLDGDITGRIISVYDNYLSYEIPSVGDYDAQFEVTNSAGDSSLITLSIEIYDPEEESLAPVVNLKRYITYVKKGETFDPYKYLKSVTLRGVEYAVSEKSEHEWGDEDGVVKGLIGDPENTTTNKVPSVLFYSDLSCDNTVNTQVAGAYNVKYSVTTEDGIKGSASLAVIVEE